jgi:hypothetical protein
MAPATHGDRLEHQLEKSPAPIGDDAGPLICTYAASCPLATALDRSRPF